MKEAEPSSGKRNEPMVAGLPLDLITSYDSLRAVNKGERLDEHEQFLGAYPKSYTMIGHLIGYRHFVDGTTRPIYEDPLCQQYVLHDDGEREYGIWLIPQDECCVPIIVEAGDDDVQ